MLPGGGHGIVDTAAAAYRLAPRLKRSIALQAVQYRVHDTFSACDHRAGAASDGLNDLIAVHLLLLEQAEDQEFRNSVHKIRIGLARHHRRRIIHCSSRHCKAINTGADERALQLGWLGLRTRPAKCRWLGGTARGPSPAQRVRVREPVATLRITIFYG